MFPDKNPFALLKSQGTEKIKFFSQGTDDSQHLKYESLVVADYDCVKFSSLKVLRIKLQLKEGDNLYTDLLRYSFKFIPSKVQILWNKLSSLGHNFICKIVKMEIFTDSNSAITRVSFPKLESKEILVMKPQKSSSTQLEL